MPHVANTTNSAYTLRSGMRLAASQANSICSSLSRRKAGSKSNSRLVSKDGSYHIEHIDSNYSSGKKHFRNLFHIMLEIKWRYVVVALVVLCPMSWTLFAAAYYLIAYLNGDFEHHIGKVSTAIVNNGSSREPCVQNVNGFLSMLLFSIESQETIGYGYRYTTEQCKGLLVLLALQYVFGGVLQACLCAIIWVRMLRPKGRGQSVIFSKRACIARNHSGDFCLIFRLSDMNGTHLVQSGVRLYMAKKERVLGTQGLFSFQLQHMLMGEDTGRDKIFFLWPTEVYHVIDKESPLYTYSKSQFERSDLEFIALTEGIVESTGLTVQTRTSYVTNEVFWGHKFKPMAFCEKNRKSKVRIKYDDFNETYPIETPECSPMEYYEKQSANTHTRKNNNVSHLALDISDLGDVDSSSEDHFGMM